MNRRFFLGSSSLFAASTLTGCASLPSLAAKHKAIVPELDSVITSPVCWWTDVLLHAVRLQNADVLSASRTFAMAHTAGYLAMTGSAIGKFDPVAIPITNPASIDTQIAYGLAFCRAAEEGLSVSLSTYRRQFIRQFAPHGLSDQTKAWAISQAQRVIKQRTNDGAERSKSNKYPSQYAKQHSALSWTATGPFYGASQGPAFQPFERGLKPNWGAQKTWVIENASDFEAAAFPAMNSNEFVRQYNKVKALGSSDSQIRTDDQTEIALFWEDGLMGVTVIGHFQLIALQLLGQRNVSLVQQARFLALNSLALADAGIVAWHNKYKTDILRPETAIRFAQSRLSSADLKADSKWTSYIPTPPFPTYVSGHSLFGAASVGIMQGLLASDKIDLTSPAPDLVNWPKQLRNVRRHFTSLSQIADENGMSREYGGVHWEIDNTEGLRLGYQLAKHVLHKQAPIV